MPNDLKTPEIFRYGATWIQSDFHLHTIADKEFKFKGEDNNFIKEYVLALKQNNINIGVIANHNKFDLQEFKALRKQANKETIFLLPGLELSINEGSNGIHTIIIFSDEWLENGNDYINQFLNVAFQGKTPNEFEQENGRSSSDLLTTFQQLESYNRDYFVVFAHVEQKNGLWNELSGGKLGDLKGKRFEIVRKRTLGFQKVRTSNQKNNVQQWLGDWYPAELEGSDCKEISQIGKGRPCYIKLGAFSFDAVKFSLADKSNRVSKIAISHKHSHIRSVKFTGGTLNKEEISFSPELNTMIGIRGSGKSSILEAIRYALEIPFGEKTGDQKYKQNLIGHTLSSGGKIEIEAVDRYGQIYTIRRIWEEPFSEVFIDGKSHPGLSIRETILHKPIYFGQKDLSNTGEGFEKDLVEKLLGSKLDDIRRKISEQKSKVVHAVSKLQNIALVKEQLIEQKQIKQDIEHRLKIYKDYGVEEKLQKRLDFENDIRLMKKGIQLSHDFVESLKTLLSEHQDDLYDFKGYTSKHNSQLFTKFYHKYELYCTLVSYIEKWIHEEKTVSETLLAYQEELAGIRKNMVEEFAEIERKLADQLLNTTSQNISSNEFLLLKKRLTVADQLISQLDKQEEQSTILEKSLLRELSMLNELMHTEFTMIKTELDKVGSQESSISITSAYKSDKSAFFNFLKDVFKGSGIHEKTYQGIVEQYVDFISIYKDIDNAKDKFGSNPQIFYDMFMKNLKSLLTYQTPNKFTILYRGKELQHHSLGQRASALILFILSQKENDVIIIDQPEDDLDNQTIYEDVIKLIRTLKSRVQFIFATHNPNIPVLGDAELVHSCSFADNLITIQSGSVDDTSTQKIIIDIMEGGKEAFKRRKEIYNIWNP